MLPQLKKPIASGQAPSRRLFGNKIKVIVSLYKTMMQLNLEYYAQFPPCISGDTKEREYPKEGG